MIGALRVKNEVRWIADVIASMRGLCHEIHVFDDHSTDGTPEVCERSGATVYRSTFEGLDEVRDKNYLLNQIARHAVPHEWLMMIDGDEVLAPGAAEQIQCDLGRPRVHALSLRVLYLWDRPDQVRLDGVYARLWRPSIFRFGAERFRATGNGGNFHCGNVPHKDGAVTFVSSAALLHYGYMDREDRVRKFEWYNAHDPDNAIEDRYRHMVIGDLYPPDARFKHGGPLHLQPLVR